MSKARPFQGADASRYPVVIGCDEVGYGALCGPVVVAACWFTPAALPAGLLDQLDDSKALSAGARERLAPLLRAHARWALAGACAGAVDRDGLRPATLAAMRRAVLRLGIAAEVVCDGTDHPRIPGMTVCCMPRAEVSVPQVAAASILAKVARDRAMKALHHRYPAFGWASNAGYGSSAHLRALVAHGPTRHHRTSYAPVQAALVMGRQGSFLDSAP